MSKKRRKWEPPTSEPKSESAERPKNGQLVVPPHGRGLIRHGSLPGNTPGTGRPPSVIRDQLRGSFAERISVLEEIADGDPIVKVKDATGRETGATMSASPSDRLKALDLMGKYGMGEKQDTDWRSHPDVLGFLAAVERSIRLRAPEVAELVIQDVKLALKPGGE